MTTLVEERKVAAADVGPHVEKHVIPANESNRATDRLSFARARPLKEARESPLADIIGDSPALRAVLKQLAIVAPTNATVLVHGETGTGKELIARALHRMSGRRDGVITSINCAAIPAGLLESELFGQVPSPGRLPAKSAASSSRTRGPCSSMKSGTCHSSFSRSYCASSRSTHLSVSDRRKRST